MRVNDGCMDLDTVGRNVVTAAPGGSCVVWRVDEMKQQERETTLEDLRDEMLQLRSQQARGGSASNSGSYKQTRRSIARLLTKMNQEKEE